MATGAEESPVFTGQFFSQTVFAREIRDFSTRDAILIDDDGIRGNSPDEAVFQDFRDDPTVEDGTELFNGFLVFDTVNFSSSIDDGEASVTVFFDDGSSISNVLALFDRFSVFSVATQFFLLDQEALTEAGRTIDEVVEVGSVRLVDHDLDFNDFGFVLEGSEPIPGVNSAPIAIVDSFEVNADGSLSVDAASGVLANDIDPDGDPLTASLVAGPENGTLTFNDDGSFVFTPDAGFVGIDRFTYEVSDGEFSSEAEVQIEVTEPPEFNVILGTSRSDRLTGTDGDDAIIAGGGFRDLITGGAGADAFIFGGEADNGRRDRDIILDFDSAEDTLVLEQGAAIRSISERRDDVRIQLEGRDRDLIILRDVEGGVDAVNIVFEESVFIA